MAIPLLTHGHIALMGYGDSPISLSGVVAKSLVLELKFLPQSQSPTINSTFFLNEGHWWKWLSPGQQVLVWKVLSQGTHILSSFTEILAVILKKSKQWTIYKWMDMRIFCSSALKLKRNELLQITDKICITLRWWYILF